MAETTEDTEPLPELPSLGDGDDSLPEGDVSELLRSFEGEADLDDTAAEDLDAGVELEDDSPPDADDVETPLDVGEIVMTSDDDDGGGFDEMGPETESTGAPFDDASSFPVDEDDAEGMLEPEDLIPEELPGLSVAEGDDQEGALTEEPDELLGMTEEEPPRRAELPWLELEPVRLGACRIVRFGKTRALAGGSGVASVGDDGDVQNVVESLGESVTALVADPDGNAILGATESGRLFKLGGNDGFPEELTTFREAVAIDRARPLTLTLGGPTASTRPAVLLHVSAGGGTLLESTDRGTTWRRVALEGHVLAVSSGAPPLCAVEDETSSRLFRSEKSGGFRPVGSELTLEEPCSIASEGDTVVVLERGLGVRVSADAGVTFNRVTGSARATAITAGRLGGRASAFAALFDVASGHTSLVWIDAASADAHIVSELSPDPDQDDDLDEWARIDSLAWDADGETLWGAGVFGLRRWRRPPSA